jgi:uncharacterized protein (DUF362 family)
MTREAITLAGGLNGIVKSGDNVVLKPNIECAFYNWGGGPTNGVPMEVNGIGADWRVIQATAEIVRESVGVYDSINNKGKITLIEGPGTGGSGTNHFTVMGWTTDKLTAVNQIIALDSEGSTYSAGASNTTGDILTYNTQITLPDFKYTTVPTGAWTGASTYRTYYGNSTTGVGDGKYWVNKKLLEADVLISIPVLKQHQNAAVTGSIKNIGIGAAPPKIYGINGTNNIGRNGMVNHASVKLHEWSADYFSCLPVDFTVMDGLQGVQKGPGAGLNQSELTSNQKNMRLIMASNDPLALDIVEANIINWDYTEVPYMTYLAEKGQVHARGEIGKPSPRMIPLRGNPKDIVVLGNKKVDEVRINFEGTMGAGNQGRLLTAAQLTKPTVTINSAAFSGANLNLGMTVSSGTDNAVVKVDVYIDGAYKKSFNSDTGMTSVSLDASSLAAGLHNIEVRAYTKFMSCTVANTSATK